MNKNLQFLKKHYFKGAIKLKKLGGQTNSNWLAECRGKKFFVRIPWESGVINRKVEGKNILALSRNRKVARIVPRYFVYVLDKRNILNANDPQKYLVPDGTMVAEYIAGKELTMEQFKKPEFQKKLAQTFVLFHQSGVRFVNPYNVFRNEIQKYRIEASKHQLEQLVDAYAVQELRALEKGADQQIVPLKRGVSTHNDFLFQNLIVDKNHHIFIVDFEYAGLNKKGGILYDIGYFFVDHLFRTPRMTKPLFEKFLDSVDKAYKKKLNRDQIYWSTVAALLVQIWWGAMRYFSVPKKEQPYFRAYTKKRVRGISTLVNELK
ncbi:MAG: phosphotransferase [Candidatus Wildermuthbacteria bacterium]|nr:phosphotransferase [Candidatus Wildermuthbacteria bacterium]